MSTFEYNDLYLKCQDTGIYHMYIFDIIGSRNMTSPYRRETQNKMIKLMTRMYKTIEKIEKTTGKKILVFDDDFVTYKSGKEHKGFGFKREPFLFGDTFGFTIYRDSLDKDIIYYIYEYYKELLKIDFDFHIADGYYETNDYSKCCTEYFRGYCMDILSVLHKDNTIKELKRLRKKLDLKSNYNEK